MEQVDPIIFIGVSDFSCSSGAPFPYGAIDLYKLSQHKPHIFYPGFTSDNAWVFLINSDFLKSTDLSKLIIKIIDENGNEFGRVSYATNTEPVVISDDPNKAQGAKPNTIITDENKYILSCPKIKGVVNHPGKYTVQYIYDGITKDIGTVHFHYTKTPDFTIDQIQAIESDPTSADFVLFEIGCKFCSSKLHTYTGLQRSSKYEDEGYIWQKELPDNFTCECGKSNIKLKYLRESLHGMLLKTVNQDVSGLSYVRRYAHEQVIDTVRKYTKLLDKSKKEQPIQEFIENNPILLARFHAKRLFAKPNIIGKFEADFAVIDSRNQLWLIELEKPSMKIFKKDGHPTQALMHAYGQVVDWLDEYRKHPNAVLDILKIKEDIMAVRGAVIAGRSKNLNKDMLQRYLSNPLYPNIEFMTCDDIATNLLGISRTLI